MPNTLYDLRQFLNEEGIFFCFSGPVSQRIVAEIAQILEHTMNLEKAERLTVTRLFALIVEKLQNILHYSDEKVPPDDTSAEQDLRFGILAIGYKNESYFVLSGNVIARAKIEKLAQKLTAIQNMDKNQLKEYYKEKRRSQPEEGSKGAGIGLIEMARKASQPIEFNFTDIDETLAFFSLKIVI